MSGAQATGSSMMLAPVLAGLRALGREPEVLLGQHGLSEARLADPQVRIDNATILAVWDDAPVVVGDENFGLLAAREYGPGMFHVLDYLVATAPTLGESLARGARHGRLLHDLFRVELLVEGREATLVQQPGTQMPLPRAQGDFFMGALVLLVRRLSGRDGAPLQVGFRHSAPKDPTPAQRLFRCPVVYRAGENTITFPAAVLQMPSREADPQLANVVVAHADLLAQQLPVGEPLLVQIKRCVAHGLRDAPTLATTARALGMSERTLRRRLEACDTSFQCLLDELRVEAALRLLRDDSRGLDEVALDVGLSGRRALTRALRRATGKTPTQLRAELRSAGGSATPTVVAGQRKFPGKLAAAGYTPRW